MQERGPDPKGGHHCYKWGHEPDRNAIVCASTRGHGAGRSWGSPAEEGLPPETAREALGNSPPSAFLVGIFRIQIV